MADSKLLPLTERIAALQAIAPTHIEVDAIRLLLGNPAPLQTQREVSVAFRQSSNTVSHSWRTNGMPGAPGRYDPAEILAWLLRRNQRNNAAPIPNEMDAIKLESEKALLQIRQAKAARSVGAYMPTPLVRSFLGALGNKVRDSFQGLPSKYKPRWPAQHANEWSEDMARDIAAILTMISETSLAEMQTYMEQQEQKCEP